MTTHALRTWTPLHKPLVAYISEDYEAVYLLAFAFERDTMLYVTTRGKVIEAAQVMATVE